MSTRWIQFLDWSKWCERIILLYSDSWIAVRVSERGLTPHSTHTSETSLSSQSRWTSQLYCYTASASDSSILYFHLPFPFICWLLCKQPISSSTQKHFCMARCGETVHRRAFSSLAADMGTYGSSWARIHLVLPLVAASPRGQCRSFLDWTYTYTLSGPWFA